MICLLPALVRRLYDIRFLRYVGASVGALALDVCIFFAALALDVAPGPASALGYSSGILAHWFISSRAVFQDGMIARRQERTVQKALFVLSALAGLVLTTLIVTLADLAMIDAHLAKIFAIIASFLLTYALRAQIVFKPGSFR